MVDERGVEGRASEGRVSEGRGPEVRLEQRLRRAPLARLVALAGQVTSRRFNRAVGGSTGLSAASGGVLAVLAWDDGRARRRREPARLTHAELARRCLIPPGTLTGIVDTLAAAGYVRRERDETDRRVVWLVATEEGTALAAEIGAHIRTALAPTKVEQDPAKQAVIREYLVELIMTNRDGE